MKFAELASGGFKPLSTTRADGTFSPIYGLTAPPCARGQPHALDRQAFLERNPGNDENSYIGCIGWHCHPFRLFGHTSPTADAGGRSTCLHPTRDQLSLDQRFFCQGVRSDVCGVRPDVSPTRRAFVGAEHAGG